MTSQTYSPSRMRKLKNTREFAIIQVFVQLVVVVTFMLFGVLNYSSLTLIVLAAIAAGIMEVNIRKENRKLAIERLAAQKRQEDENRRLQREQRIGKLLSSEHASQSLAYKALVEAGAIRLKVTNDPLNVAYIAGAKPTDEEWDVFDFFFKRTEDVVGFMASNNHPEAQTKGKAFLDDEAQAVVRKLADLHAQRAREIDDIIWRSTMMIDTQ